jgi:hypothetical protein
VISGCRLTWLLAMLGASLGLCADDEQVDVEVLLDRFDPNAIPQEPWVFGLRDAHHHQRNEGRSLGVLWRRLGPCDFPPALRQNLTVHADPNPSRLNAGHTGRRSTL